MATRTITKDESNILVAIGKLETQMENMGVDIAATRSEIKEINTDTKARILNLESNAVNKIEVYPRLEKIEKDILDLQNSRLEFRASLKAWVIIGGAVWSIILIVVSVLIAKHFGA